MSVAPVRSLWRCLVGCTVVVAVGAVGQPVAGGEAKHAIAVYNMPLVLRHIAEKYPPEDRFLGPEGDRYREEIRAMMERLEGEETLSQAERMALNAELRRKRKALSSLRPDPRSRAQEHKKLALRAVREYAVEAGYMLVFEHETVGDSTADIIVPGDPVDITQAVIQRITPGDASLHPRPDGGFPRRHVRKGPEERSESED